MKLFSFVRDSLSRMFDPVLQDWSADIYVDYKGYLVQLVPVADPNNPSRIAEWRPDPDGVEQAEIEEAKKNKDRENDCADKRSENPDPSASAKSAFNPANSPGL